MEFVSNGEMMEALLYVVSFLMMMILNSKKIRSSGFLFLNQNLLMPGLIRFPLV